ncbi:hydroxymethylglutaryl-CoA lyase [Flaviaesturariibacter aridisoli]|uniref:Hydroxymethylglutaryl-CoA lyase n=1 Tax=Flaviaesturariibacter aridisoli TaxID=2545761 RepID=A0A4R4E4X4_9BACT|nr:hydroxymethylglutaryl-CoA lyase [Flaviaesturariibacter aridisoli]TCZ73893.1 hydroxymethylglutaryl-CoA lyase [Flaviaesturariibacter aridisoli]
MSATPELKIVECPRDAMQGWKTSIPTAKKVQYLNTLLRVGFDTLDFGSFVSPKAIPQMADTADVLPQLNTAATRSKLLAIVANVRGAESAVSYAPVRYLGFPFSVSETFQQRNTNASIAEGLDRVKEIQQLCTANGKELVVYLSMGFGNPYGDPWSEEVVLEWARTIAALGVPILSLADTVGLATPEQIDAVTRHVVEALPGSEIGVHLHASADGWREKVEAAYEAGCRRFDGALKGIGGCPMANDALVGNMNTEWLIRYFSEKGHNLQLDAQALEEALQLANEIFV